MKFQSKTAYAFKQAWSIISDKKIIGGHWASMKKYIKNA